MKMTFAPMILILLAGWAPVCAEERKVATIDVERILNEYPRFRDGLQSIGKLWEKIQKGRDLAEKFRSVRNKWDDAQKRANEVAIDKIARAQAKNLASALESEMIEILLSMDPDGYKWTRNLPADSGEQWLANARQKFIDEIVAMAQEEGERGHWDFVFDASAIETLGSGDGVLIANREKLHDLTGDLMQALRRREEAEGAR